MIDLEARESRQLQTQIWKQTSAQRQTSGLCIANLLIKGKKVGDD